MEVKSCSLLAVRSGGFRQVLQYLRCPLRFWGAVPRLSSFLCRGAIWYPAQLHFLSCSVPRAGTLLFRSYCGVSPGFLCGSHSLRGCRRFPGPSFPAASGAVVKSSFLSRPCARSLRHRVRRWASAFLSTYFGLASFASVGVARGLSWFGQVVFVCFVTNVEGGLWFHVVSLPFWSCNYERVYLVLFTAWRGCPAVCFFWVLLGVWVRRKFKRTSGVFFPGSRFTGAPI